MTKPGRNDVCSCGSGKKYKHCCWVSDGASPSIDAAISLHQKGQTAEAQVIYEAILEKQPNHAHALHFLGVILYQQKHYPLAEQFMRRSIAANPAEPMYYCNLGMLLRDEGKFSEAIENHRKALALQPIYPEAHLNLGVALSDLEQLDEAAKSLKRAIELEPGSVKAHDNLGTVMRCQYDYAGSIRQHERAIELNPGYVVAYANLAATFIEVKNFPMASFYALKGAEVDPTYADTFLYLGIVCQEQGDLEGSERFFLHAHALAPQNKTTLWNLAITRLALGKLELGWQGYEYRWVRESGAVMQRCFPYPWWQGERIPDKTILIWGEQGIGDEIMFANMFEEVIPLFKQCIIACTKKLIPLFQRAFPATTIVDVRDAQRLAELADSIDVQSAAGSLARWLRPTVASFPKKSHYLIPDARRVTYWKTRLAELGGELKVGICWRTGNLVGNRMLYCTLLEQWGAILSIPGVRFINLQYDDCADELEEAGKQFGVHIHNFTEVDLFDDLDETAALIKSLDLVISAPTSVSLLAAALGAPTWMMVCGFEWQKIGTPDICWYSTARLFHKNWDQKWDGLIEQVAHELANLSVKEQMVSDCA